jgi:hypothetical protein
VAAPAAAQSYGYGQDRYGHGYSQGYNHGGNRAAQIDRRIEQGQRRGAITQREAWRLRSQLNQIVRLERQYAHNGINRREAYELDRRYEQLLAQVRYERRDDDRYGYGRGGGYRY